MRFYFAPMEGITGYIYRNAYNKYFRSIDKFFTPFISPGHNRSMKTKELNDILPEHNIGYRVVPQILTKSYEDFINTARKLAEYGYDEINLNLGCPSPTVVTKDKGAGFLAKPEALDEFLYRIFESACTKISIKTRIGRDEPEEFYRLMEIYNKYDMEELIIHPRIQKDMYRNTPNLDMFEVAARTSTNPICYNGDIFKKSDFDRIHTGFPAVEEIMLGRGLLANPGLVDEIKSDKKLDKETLRQFHDQLYEDYRGILFGDTTVLFRMKEMWFYMINMFSDNDKYLKKIRKSERLSDYETAVSALFREQDIIDGGYSNGKKC